MNRIQLSASVAQSDVDLHKDDAFLSGSKTQARAIPLASFTPLHYEPNYAYPLLIWLQGPGDDERQLNQVMPHISMRNYVAVGPRAVMDDTEHGVGYCWPQTPASIEQAEQVVFDSLEQAVARFNINSERIFIAGYGCGATMAYRIAFRHPHRFAGVAAVRGPFPEGNSPLFDLDSGRRVPVFIANGRDAEAYPIEQTCEELRLLHAAGLSVTLRQYPCGDELTTQMLHDLDVWLMEQVTGQSEDAQAHRPRIGELN